MGGEEDGWTMPEARTRYAFERVSRSVVRGVVVVAIRVTVDTARIRRSARRSRRAGGGSAKENRRPNCCPLETTNDRCYVAATPVSRFQRRVVEGR